MPKNRHLYKINIDRSIRNQIDLMNLIASIVSGYCYWRESLYFNTLRQKGWTLKEIGKITNRSRASMSIFKKSLSFLNLMDSGGKQAPADERATACLSPLSTKKTSAMEHTVAGQTIAEVGQANSSNSSQNYSVKKESTIS